MSEYVEDISGPNTDGENLKMVRCPACDANLEDAGQAKVRRHLAEHDPAELGITAEPGDTFGDEAGFERILGGDR